MYSNQTLLLTSCDCIYVAVLYNEIDQVENEFVAKFFQDIDDEVLLPLFHETSGHRVDAHSFSPRCSFGTVVMQVPAFLQTAKLHVPCQWIGMQQHVPCQWIGMQQHVPCQWIGMQQHVPCQWIGMQQHVPCQWIGMQQHVPCQWIGMQQHVQAADVQQSEERRTVRS